MKTAVNELRYSPAASSPAETPHQTTAGLKSRTFTNGIVTATAQGVQLALNIGSTIVLARLLAPNDFGIVAIVLSLIGFFRVFSDMGLSSATIQRATITPAQISNLFWINIGVGALVTCLFALASPLIAWFFHEPRLTAVMLVLSLYFVLAASTVQQLALMKRHMEFPKIAFIQVSAFFGAVCAGVIAAFWGFGYWSLVAMQLGTPLLTCIITWIVSDWRPQLPQRRSGTGPLVGFGLRLAVSSLIWSVARGSDTILVGKVFGSAALGFYSRAAALLIRPIDQLMSPIEAVVVPTLSRLLPEPERYRRAVLEIYEFIAVGTFFFSGLVFALSHPLILVLLGPKWHDSIPIFAGFSLLTLYIPLGCVAGWLMTSQGRGKDSLRVSMIASVATTCAFFVGLAFGPAGVATGYSLCCIFVSLPLSYYVGGREGPVKTGDLWRRFFTHLPLWFVVAGATFLGQSAVHHASTVARLLVGAASGLICGCIFLALFPASRQVVLSMRDNLVHWRASFARRK